MPEQNSILLKDTDKWPDSLQICYQTIDPTFFAPVFQWDITNYTTRPGVRQSQVSPTVSRWEEAEIFSLGDVQSYGAITRGISFGNRQNVFVNSSLNLQMEGALSEDLKVSAVITDQNIPYQPEGNTQQIRDFDNVFIKLYTDDLEVIAGDVVLQNPVENSYFLQYYKNVQGLSLWYRYALNEKWKARTTATGSIAKGQFTSAVIQPIEGVQGPYKLRGPNGERFIVVLGNSERVFLDGLPLRRGFDRDYVIDYNLGEITFSNSIVITRFSRIRIDFEYADQYYVRSNLSATQELYTDRAKVYFNFYREKDNPTSTLSFDLTDDDLQALRQAGDNPGLSAISGVDSTGFIENAILYEKVDTVDIEGRALVIYQYSNDPNRAQFRLSFSNVGLGNGNYIRGGASANGQVYEWVSQINGVSQGDFEPIQVIPLPNQKQMLVMGSRVKLSEHEEVFQELAVSTADRNLYSDVDDGDNTGFAWKGGITSENRKVDFLPDYRISSAVTLELDQRHFTFIDRFRSVDFDRDWGYDVFEDTITRPDRILNATLFIQKDSKNQLGYEGSQRNRDEVIDGSQHQLRILKEAGPLLVRSENFWMRNSFGDHQSQWLRMAEGVKLTAWKLQPGYLFSLDQNTVRRVANDSITSTLMHFTAHDFYMETGDTSQTRLRLDYIRRNDQLPALGEMVHYTRADELRASMNTSLYKTQKVGVQLNYRKVKELIGERQTDENLLGRVDWSGSYFNHLVQQRMTYSHANTRELLREFVYLRVASGEGTHTWRDENEDGIQDLNEFYEAINQDEKNYIKLFTPTDQYINAYQTSYVQTVDARMPSDLGRAGSFLGGLSRLAYNASLRYDVKTTDDSLPERLQPISGDLTDEEILYARNQSRHTLFYNRNAPGLGGELTKSTQSSKSLLSGGFELVERKDWQTSLRYSFGVALSARMRTGWGTAGHRSDFLDSRNFELAKRQLVTELIWQPTQSVRLISGYERRTKETSGGEETGSSRINEYRIETTWVSASRSNLNASLHWIGIGFEGEEGSFLGYELLEALQPGNNQRWRVNWQQTVGKGLQLTLQYQGRKSGEAAVIHTGTMQVTAFF